MFPKDRLESYIKDYMKFGLVVNLVTSCSGLPLVNYKNKDMMLKLIISSSNYIQI